MKVNKVLKTARLASWVYRVLALVSGFVVIRLINEGVGLAGYGHIAFVLSLYSALVVFDFGVLQSISRFVARYQSPELGRYLPRFWVAIFVLVLILFLLQILLLLIVAIAASNLQHLKAVTTEQLVLIGIFAVIANFLTVANSIYAGYQQYFMATSAKIARVFVYIIAIVSLWATESLSVLSVLWVSVISTFACNCLVLINLLLCRRTLFQLDWHRFPTPHVRIFSDIASFSLYGWLITLSSVLISSGGVVAAGAVLSAIDAAKIQIAIVFLNGMAAFMTGGMTPLTTISARFSDGSPESLARRADATGQLLNETLLLSAIALIFSISHLSPFIGLLLDSEDRTPELLSQVHLAVIVVLIPAIASMPLYLFKYALVEKQENARYGKSVLIGTLAVLAVGAVITFIFNEPILLAAAIGVATAFRSIQGYRLGRANLPGVSMPFLFFSFLKMLLVFGLLSGICKLIPFNVSIGEFTAAHVQGMVYGFIVICIYFYRKSLSAVLGVRIKGRPY